MLNVLTYSHGYGMGSWVAYTVARGLIYRAVWTGTRGMALGTLILLVVLAVVVCWLMRRA